MSSLLDDIECCILYKSPVRQMMEYCPLTWSSSSKLHSDLFEVVQRRAKRLIDSEAPTGSGGQKLQPLQHSREVSALRVFYKVHTLNLLHLNALKMAGAYRTMHNTRGASRSQYLLCVPFARTEQFLRCFQPKYVKLWNLMVGTTNIASSPTLQEFKITVHRWRLPAA